MLEHVCNPTLVMQRDQTLSAYLNSQEGYEVITLVNSFCIAALIIIPPIFPTFFFWQVKRNMLAGFDGSRPDNKHSGTDQHFRYGAAKNGQGDISGPR